MTMTVTEQRETAHCLIAEIGVNRHHALLSWAQRNHEKWVGWHHEAVADSLDWHVAKVESAYWHALIEMLKERMA